MYMHRQAIQAQYGRLKPRPHEHHVDTMWAMILPRYFSDDSYIIEREANPFSDGRGGRADIMVRTVHKVVNGDFKRVLMFENKRVEEEGRTSTWEDALQQLQGYVLAARAAEYQPGVQHDTMYAVITVGHYSRFYEMPGNRNQLQDYPEAGGQALEFKQDEAMIDYILKSLVQKTTY